MDINRVDRGETVVPPDPKGEKTEPKLEPGQYGDIQMQRLHAQLAREKEEPTEGFSQIPIILLFLFGALMFYGGLYLTKYSGAFRADIYDPNVAIDEGGGGEVIDWNDPAVFAGLVAERGERAYSTCAACHQPDGNGLAGQFPPLNLSEWVGGDPARITKIVINGLAGPIEVRGNPYNANMAGLGYLKDRDIALAVSYVRTAWDNDYPLVTPAEVKAIRDSLGGRTSQWSGDELLELYPIE
ncbi:MAG: c-type cytochrome [Opitutales bacterium]